VERPGGGGANLIISIDFGCGRDKCSICGEAFSFSCRARFTLGRLMISFIISIKSIDKFPLPNVSIMWK
jgi:hypothetical protein